MENNSTIKNSLLNQIRKAPQIIWMIIALILVFTIINPAYFALSNFKNILVQSIPLIILGLAQTFVILTEGIDLSIGGQVSFVTVMWIFLLNMGFNIFLAAIITVIIVILIGCINGILVAKFNIPPFIATLGVYNVLYGVSLLLTAGASIYFPSSIYSLISDSSILFIPFPVWIGIILFGFAWIALYKTKFGTNIFAIGGNKEALTLAGVNTAIPIIKTYAFAAFMAAIAGLITACRIESGQPVIALGWEFDAVAATILGGTSFEEGKGGITGTVFGALFIQVLKNGLNIVGISTLYQNATIGIIVLLAIVVDACLRRYRE